MFLQGKTDVMYSQKAWEFLHIKSNYISEIQFICKKCDVNVFD